MALNDFLYTIDPNTMLLGLLFIIFYIFINFSLSKIFRNDRSSSTIVSLCVSLLAVYGINRTNFDINGLFSRMGLNSDLIYTVVPWIILGLAILASFGKDANGKRKFRFYRFFMILGAFLVLLSFFAYEQGILMIIGIALILLGLFLFWRSKKKGIPQTPGTQKNTDGRDALIRAAKQFNGWARKQSNPKFVGTWANFINWLGKGGWGSGEAAICQKLNISTIEFTSIFNKYGLVR